MLSVDKDYFEEILASAAQDIIKEFSRKDAEILITRYFPRKEYLTKKEAASMLSCSTRQIDYLRENQNLPWFNNGSNVMFSARDIRLWVESQKHCGHGAVPSTAYIRKDK